MICNQLICSLKNLIQNRLSDKQYKNYKKQIPWYGDGRIADIYFPSVYFFTEETSMNEICGQQ